MFRVSRQYMRQSNAGHMITNKDHASFVMSYDQAVEAAYQATRSDRGNRAYVHRRNNDGTETLVLTAM